MIHLVFYGFMVFLSFWQWGQCIKRGIEDWTKHDQSSCWYHICKFLHNITFSNLCKLWQNNGSLLNIKRLRVHGNYSCSPLHNKKVLIQVSNSNVFYSAVLVLVPLIVSNEMKDFMLIKRQLAHKICLAKKPHNIYTIPGNMLKWKRKNKKRRKKEKRRKRRKC